VAQLNIYDTNREGSGVGGDHRTGSFVIPNGTELVAVLNNDLSTQNVREGDRFTMTVRSPGQYDGATIEGTVVSVNRGGRVSGRSEMTLDFDTIRTRDGRSYRFAGILESFVRRMATSFVSTTKVRFATATRPTRRSLARPSVPRLARSLVRLPVVVKARRLVL
jgi:hypothetical protein